MSTRESTPNPTHHVGSVTDIGHGNPSTLEAHRRLATEAGIVLHTLPLRGVAAPGKLAHVAMTQFGRVSSKYTEHSEGIRASLPARIFGQLLFLEFAARVLASSKITRNEKKIHWLVVQEHVLQGSWSTALDFLGIDKITVSVPDVLPKQSAEDAVRSHSGRASFSVWNTFAQEHLATRFLPSTLNQPPLLAGYYPETSQFMREGKRIVVKSSGSGMKKTWIKALNEELRKISPQTCIHLPAGKSLDDYQNFMNDLGGKTKLVIAHPSEITQIVASMRASGVEVTLLALPPRGTHEEINLEHAMQMGIVAALIDFEDGSNTSNPKFSKLARIRPCEIADLLGTPSALSDVHPFLGTEPLIL